MKYSLQKSQNIKFLKNHFKFSTITSKNVESYNKDGYVHIPGYFSKSEIYSLKDEMSRIINNIKEEDLSKNNTFRTDSPFFVDYMLESGDKTRFFFENDTFNEDGTLKYPVAECINKVGHGTHDENPVFRKFCYSEKIKNLFRALGYIKPMIVQSMYIFKSKRIGGEVGSHIDNTFIISNPLSCVGFWIALDDASKENGALYAVPGSHKLEVDYFMKRKIDENGKIITAFNKLKPDYDISNSVCLEAKQGDLVILHGSLVHYSHKNNSEKSRHAFTLHSVESHNTEWDKGNWLQRPSNNPFTTIQL